MNTQTSAFNHLYPQTEWAESDVNIMLEEKVYQVLMPATFMFMGLDFFLSFRQRTTVINVYGSVLQITKKSKQENVLKFLSPFPELWYNS
jgi:hypothetical protein